MVRGKSIAMTHDRRLVCDLVEIARRMPIAPIERTLELSELARLRRRARPKISWQVLMMRAYALVARDNPLLRRVYVGWPREYYYEHPENVCLLTISREVEGENQLIFARFNQPENHSLAQLQEQFDNFRSLPLDQIKHFKHQVRFSKMPRFLRRIGWSLLMNWMPASRAKLMGTFGMSLSGLRDTYGTWHLGPGTTILGYDQFCADGFARLTLTFDHRVLDGKPAFDVLASLNSVLRGQMCNELKMMCPPKTELMRPHQLRIAA